MCSVATDNYKGTNDCKGSLLSLWGMSAGSVRLVRLLTFQQPYSLKPPGTSLVMLPCHLICSPVISPPPHVQGSGLCHARTAYPCVLQCFTLAYLTHHPGWAAWAALSSAQVMRAPASKLVAQGPGCMGQLEQGVRAVS